MPFTISHVAAVLPFSRLLARRRLLSAAVIGSMVPDFGWLTSWRPARFETHSLPSLLTFSLPVGLATFWMFQRLMKPALIELLPDTAYARTGALLAPWQPADPLEWWFASLGVLFGAISHLVWDAFTHEGALGIRMIPALDDPALALGSHHIVGARLLQDVSSVIGLVLVVGWCAYELRPGPTAVRGGGAVMVPPGNLAVRPARRLSPSERHLWTLLLAGTAALASALLFLERFPDTSRGLSVPLSGAAIAILRGIAIALLLVSGLLWLRLRPSPPGQR